MTCMRLAVHGTQSSLASTRSLPVSLEAFRARVPPPPLSTSLCDRQRQVALVTVIVLPVHVCVCVCVCDAIDTSNYPGLQLEDL